MKDRFTIGFLSGLAGWLPQFLFMTAMYYVFHLTKLLYFDFAAIIAYGHKPQNWQETSFAVLIVIGFLGVLGAVFAFAIKIIQSPNILFKGAVFGAGDWFLIYAITYVFKVEGLYKQMDFPTAVINLIGGTIWGISTALMLVFLNRRYRSETMVKEDHHHTTPKKYYFAPSHSRKHDEEIKPVRLKKPIKIKQD
ncbi:MAG: hypothetical protein BGN88_12830 [Clostridiales bacterium 43-6]|nr:MAG: hypothetical protein BGN88_12830 [Clostridiales bacterium 43-6]